MTALSITRLSKTYGHYRVLNELSLDIHAHQCFALFGPNGAGKTTLMRILATLARPSSGHFTVWGYDGTSEKHRVRQIIMYMAHGTHLYDDLNAVENLRFCLALRGHIPSDAQIKRALDRVQIGAFGQMPTRYFSAGMKKRLGLAKAILARPKVLLLDEPYASLDERGVSIMNAFIRETMQDEGAVLMTTHDREHTVQVANSMGVLNRGVLQTFEPHELETHVVY